jgi:hypothetical protein
MWIVAAIGPAFIVESPLDTATWSNILTLASLPVPMIVNALVTGLIVFRIFKVFHEVKSITTGGRKLRSIIFIIIESGMTLFAIQLAQVVIRAKRPGLWTNAEEDIYQLIGGTLEMLNVVISSVIVTLYFTDNVAARV